VGLTDSITFTCAACGHSAEFPKAQEGKAIYCPKCQAAQVVRAAGTGTDRFQVERIPTGRIAKAETAPSTDRIEKPHGMAGTARLDFTCGACNHSARISAALSGQPVRCPACGTVQLAGVAAMRVVRLDGSGKLPFTCTACNYQARLNPDYAGKAIRCPKCQGAQVVPRVLRESSGAHPVLPSGASIVRTEPGTGTIRKDGTGSVRKTTGSFRKDQPSTLSEPSSALRTPAGGIPIAQPLSQPTPLPGSFATPPPGAITAQGDTLPEPQRAQSSPQLPLVPMDKETDELDLGDTAPTAAVKPAPAKGSVVRRSGRMAAAQQRTPVPNAEPTLEPARAVQPEPDLDEAPMVPSTPIPAAVQAPARQTPTPKVSEEPRAAHAPATRGGPPAWIIPVLGVVAAVGVISSVVLVLMTMSNAERAQVVEGKLEAANKGVAVAAAENDALKGKLIDSEKARSELETKRAELAAQIETLRAELAQSASDIERLKAEAAKPAPLPAPLPAVGQPGPK
jgi:DNA-directed RNA polymerase subunit RPC12/RpoP